MHGTTATTAQGTSTPARPSSATLAVVLRRTRSRTRAHDHTAHGQAEARTHAQRSGTAYAEAQRHDSGTIWRFSGPSTARTQPAHKHTGHAAPAHQPPSTLTHAPTQTHTPVGLGRPSGMHLRALKHVYIDIFTPARFYVRVLLLFSLRLLRVFMFALRAFYFTFTFTSHRHHQHPPSRPHHLGDTTHASRGPRVAQRSAPTRTQLLAHVPHRHAHKRTRCAYTQKKKKTREK